MSQQLVLKDAAKSKLTRADITSLGFKFLTKQQTEELTGKPVRAYKIPYVNNSKNSTKEFFRIKFLDPVYNHKDKLVKYWQSPGTNPRLYFPSIGKIEWSKIKKDPTIKLFITEGEKKAACACKHGMYTIGLGGVWSWKCKRLKQSLITDFEDIKLDGREVCIVFDNDVHENSDVMAALQAFSQALTREGAVVSTIKLPFNTQKMGLDDYIAVHSIEAFNSLEEEIFVENEELWKMNSETAYVEALDAFYVFKSNTLCKANSLSGSVFSNRSFVRYTDEGKVKKVNAAKEWLEWPYRRTHTSLNYLPGQEEVCAGNTLNTWRGWGIQPKEGNLAPWHRLMDYTFKGKPEERKWFEQWLAYPLQHPGTKLNSAVLLHSDQQGTGKSLVGYTMRRIYGDNNFSVVSQTNLHSDFNSWAKNKQFVLGEEITGSDKRREADHMKMLITQETIEINEKYQTPYCIKDCINYLLTSNHPDALFLDRQDRRYFICEIVDTPLASEFYHNVFDPWKNSEDGPAALFHYLLNIDLKGFVPQAAPPMTDAKRSMISLSYSDLDMFVSEMIEQDDCKELVTLEELRAKYEAESGGKNVSRAAIAKSVRRAGGRKLPVTKVDGKAMNLWAMKHVKKWQAASGLYRAKQYLKITEKKNKY